MIGTFLIGLSRYQGDNIKALDEMYAARDLESNSAVVISPSESNLRQNAS